MERHRTERARRGLHRVELTLPREDVGRFRRLAAAVRHGGEPADRARSAIDQAVSQRESAGEFFDRIMVQVPPGEPLDYSRDDLAPDRDVDL